MSALQRISFNASGKRFIRGRSQDDNRKLLFTMSLAEVISILRLAGCNLESHNGDRLASKTASVYKRIIDNFVMLCMKPTLPLYASASRLPVIARQPRQEGEEVFAIDCGSLPSVTRSAFTLADNRCSARMNQAAAALTNTPGESLPALIDFVVALCNSNQNFKHEQCQRDAPLRPLSARHRREQ